MLKKVQTPEQETLFLERTAIESARLWPSFIVYVAEWLKDLRPARRQPNCRSA